MRGPNREGKSILQGQASYGAAARSFHWLTVALLLVIIPIVLVMGDLPRGIVQNTFFVTHESLGLTVLALTLARFLWRLGHPPPPSRDLNWLERSASAGVHALLYAVLIITPVTGYLFVTCSDINFSNVSLLYVPSLGKHEKVKVIILGALHIRQTLAHYILPA